MIGPIKLLVLATTLSVGSVHEEDGAVKRTFWLHNQGEDAVRVAHVWTSCGCTTATYDAKKWVSSGDSVAVTLLFDPKGKGGEFLESARVQVVSLTDTVGLNLELEGEVVSSEESIGKAYPVRVGKFRLSTKRLDFGEMKRGESKQMQVAVYGRGTIPVTLVADERVGWGAQQFSKTVEVFGEKVKMNMKVMVIDNTKPGAHDSELQTERRLPTGATMMTLRNVGSGELVVHRIYSEKGDLLSTDVTIGKKPLVVKIPPKWVEGKQDVVWTIISNDPRHLRTTVRVGN